MQPDTNIVLIGMPGSGKSTAGVLLAKRTARDFVDTDVLIQSAQRRSLQSIVDAEGYLELRRIEEQVICALQLRSHVIATGGSAVYSEAAMRHLKLHGRVVFLDVSISVLKNRVNDFETRGLARRPGQTLDDLFAERRPLYQRYADVTVACNGLAHEEVCETIVQGLANG